MKRKPRVTLYEVDGWGSVRLAQAQGYLRGDVYILDNSLCGRNRIKREQAHLTRDSAVHAFIDRETALARNYRREMDRHLESCIKAQRLL